MMKTKDIKITTLAPYEDRLARWTAAQQAAESHLSLGQQLQQQGQEIIDALNDAELTAELAMKLLQQGTTIIEKGIKIERESHDHLIALSQSIPKNFHAKF